MKKRWKLLLPGLAVSFGLLSQIPIQAENSEILTIPENTTTIEEEAFSGSTSVSKVMISKNVAYVGERAFSDCTEMKEVYFGKNKDITIEENAFDGCENLETFYVFPETKAELFALSHGYSCELLEEGRWK